jgi:O-acetyl-ADP-ribose deacetylase (regulator of RNase III)
VHEEFLDGRVIVTTGDITGETSDAIVNAANSTLLGGGGVDGAIHRKGGGRILAECREIRETEYPKGLPTGKAVITTGGDLPARYVIHTVGPIYGLNNGRDAGLLADCYRNCLALAAAGGLRTISFPSISTGAFGYPKDEAARVSSEAISEFLGSDSPISQVRLVFFSASDTENFVRYCEFSG